jgi:hypothetical protein
MEYAGFDSMTYPGHKTMQRLWDETNLWWTGFYLEGPTFSQKRWDKATKTKRSFSEWMGKLPTLRTQGWGVLPIYSGQQRKVKWRDGTLVLNPLLTAARGKHEGEDAANQAAGQGFPQGTVICLDVEPQDDVRLHEGDKVYKTTAEYYTAWCEAVIAKKFYPGVYCSSLMARDLDQIDMRPFAFVSNWGHQRRGEPLDMEVQGENTEFPTRYPGGCPGYALADAWQWKGDCPVREVVADARGHERRQAFRDDLGRPLTIDLCSATTKNPSGFWQ